MRPVARRGGIAVLLLGIIWCTARVTAQESLTIDTTSRCTLPSAGVLVGAACDTVAGLLPVPVEFRASPSVGLTRADVEAIALGALARQLDTGARADSGWAFAHRDTSHLWVGVAIDSATALQATVLYWSLMADGTLSLLCHYRGTLTVPQASVPALAVGLAAEIEAVARCARREERRLGRPPLESPPDRARSRRTALALLSALVMLAGAAVMLWRYLRPRMPDFWQVAARYPDQAYQWFLSHDDWLVIDPTAGQQPKVDEQTWDGPFLLWVPKLGGRRIVVYGRRSAMKESQRAFLTARGVDADGLPRT